MGDFKEHVLFGLLTAAVLIYFLKEAISLTVLETLTGALAVFLGSILPDVDHKRSYVHRSVKAFTSISTGIFTAFLTPFDIHYRYLAGAVTFVTVYTLFSKIKMKHRGFTHTVTFVVITTSLGVILSTILLETALPGVALGVGLLSHLLLDREFKF